MTARTTATTTAKTTARTTHDGASGVTPEPTDPPVNTVLPVVSGTLVVGQTLSVTNGTWTGSATIVFTYQWRRNNSNISGATNSTYVLVQADAGNVIDCQVTGTNGVGNATATSTETTTIFDSNASTYLAAVEAADGQSLESGVRLAVNDFVIGCKSDSIWTAIKASCILAGARTLSGALIPLVGSAPTNSNFVSGDYNRETGLIGNGTTKSLLTGRLANSDPQNNHHLSVYVSSVSSGSFDAYIGQGTAAASADHIGRFNSSNLYSRSRNATSNGTIPGGSSPGFVGQARSASTGYTVRCAGTNTAVVTDSIAPAATEISVFESTGASLHANSRQSWYSVGESINLALLDTRVTSLITAIGVAIP